MYDNFKIANYNNSLVSPEFYAKPLSRLFGGDVIDGLTVVPGTGLQVTLQPGNAFLRYGSAAVASARIVSLLADFNLAIPTPDASNPRIDLVVVYVDTAVNLPVVDATHPPTSANLDGPGVAKAKIVSGTPAATPVAPNAGAIQSSVGASNPYTVVGQVLVDKAPVSVIAAGKITDVRKRALLGSQNIDPSTFPSFRATQSTSLSVGTATTNIPFNNIVRDTGGNFNSTSGLFTAPVDGIYAFSVSIYAESNPTGRVFTSPRGTVPDVRRSGDRWLDITVASGAMARYAVSVDVDMKAGETFGISAFSSSAINIASGVGRTSFTGRLVLAVPITV